MQTESKAAAVTVREIPVELWRRVKIKAAVDGDTVQVAVTKALQQYVSAA